MFGISDDILYLIALFTLFGYTQWRGSLAFLWAGTFILVQYGLISLALLGESQASLITAISLLVVFEISDRFWEEPFSEAKVVGLLSSGLTLIGKLLAIFGVKPKSKVLMMEDFPAIVSLREQVKDHQWASVENLLRNLEDQERPHFIQGLAEDSTLESDLKNWLKASPKSALAHCVYGHLLIKKAWDARGGGVASTVTIESFQGFFDHLFHAEETFLRAIELEDKFVESYDGLITICMGASLDHNSLWGYFAKAVILSQDSYATHMNMVTALTEKWGGDRNEMFRVARRSVFNAKPGSALVAVIAHAHIEQWLGYEMDNLEKQAQDYFKQKEVREELYSAYKKFDSDTITTYNGIEALNLFAFSFYLAGQFKTAKDILKRIDGRFLGHPWGYSDEAFMGTFDIGFTLDHIISKIEKHPENQFAIENDLQGEKLARDSGLEHSQEQLEEPSPNEEKPVYASHLDYAVANDQQLNYKVKHIKNLPENGFAQLVLHNDEINGFFYVLDLLEEIFEYGVFRSVWLLIMVTFKDSYPLWTGPVRDARDYALEIISRGPDPEMVKKGAKPLNVSVEIIEL